MDVPDPRDDEVFEHIPWSQLSTPAPRPRMWIVYVAAGAIAAAAVGAMVMRSWGGSSGRPTPDTSVAELPAPSVPAAAPTVAPEPPPVPEVLREADLMAVVPGQEERTAAARAEWFVVDYFSSGGSPSGNRAVVGTLPEEATADLPEDGGLSFVEWASTWQVEPLGGGRYRARVLFRMLGAAHDGTYIRLPVRAVDVVVAVDSGGRPAVVDLPIPVAPPEPAAQSVWEFVDSEPPEAVRAAALEKASTWGGEAGVVQSSVAGDGWRVVVRVTDEAGVRWPMVVWLTPDATPVWPAS